jgi:hypothetical protein
MHELTDMVADGRRLPSAGDTRENFAPLNEYETQRCFFRGKISPGMRGKAGKENRRRRRLGAQRALASAYLYPANRMRALHATLPIIKLIFKRVQFCCF